MIHLNKRGANSVSEGWLAWIQTEAKEGRALAAGGSGVWAQTALTATRVTAVLPTSCSTPQSSPEWAAWAGVCEAVLGAEAAGTKSRFLLLRWVGGGEGHRALLGHWVRTRATGKTEKDALISRFNAWPSVIPGQKFGAGAWETAFSKAWGGIPPVVHELRSKQTSY